jgi:hypothetical protein
MHALEGSMPHWRGPQRPQQNEQTFETEPCKTEIISPSPGKADAAQQLRHAREQIALAGQYPGRAPRAAPRAEVIELHPRR